jgi:hypothetical protein
MREMFSVYVNSLAYLVSNEKKQNDVHLERLLKSQILYYFKVSWSGVTQKNYENLSGSSISRPVSISNRSPPE